MCNVLAKLGIVNSWDGLISLPSLSVDLPWNETSVPNIHDCESNVIISLVCRNHFSATHGEETDLDDSWWSNTIQNTSPNCKTLLSDLFHYFDRFKTLSAIQICMSTSRSLDSHLKFMIIYKSAWPFRESLGCFVLVKGILMFLFISKLK